MACRACENTLTRRHNGLKCSKCHACACNAACARDAADLHCCRVSGVASQESQKPKLLPGVRQQRSRRNTSIDARHGAGDGRPGGRRADGGRAVRSATPERTRGRPSCAPGVPTAFPAILGAPMEVENGHPMQIEVATLRAGQAEPQGSAEAPDPAAVFT